MMALAPFSVPALQAQTALLVAAGENDIPDAPLPSGQQQPQAAPATDPQAPPHQKTPQEQAAEDLKNEEKQRILGIMPEFNMINNADAPPLSPKQKFHLFWKSNTDPYLFGLTAIVAGIGQAQDSHEEYGQGAEGYFKRYGAAYADAFDGNFWGNAVLPIWWHEDPRYFRMGTGKVPRRILHAAMSTIWCRRDNGTWGPNYANVAGNIIGGSISNIYYPASDRGAGLVFSNALTVTAEGAIGAQLVEFWPDIVNHYRKKKLEKEAAAAAAANQNNSTTPAK